MQLTVQSHIEQTVIEQTLHDCFQLQRKSFHQQGIETIEQRKQHLLNLKALINNHREAIIDALNRDYGNRSRHETLLAEIITVTDDINGSIKHLKHWTKVQNDMSIIACILVQKPCDSAAAGVIGIIVPWNFPINLMFSQLSAVFAAEIPLWLKCLKIQDIWLNY